MNCLYVRVALLGALAAALGALPGCSKSVDPWANVPGGEPRVLTSFPPLYCFAKNVAGDDVAVLSLLTTVGPHDHKPTSQDALAVRRARLFFANGLRLDDSLSKIVKSAAGPSLKFVAVGALGVPKTQRISMGEVQHGDHTHPAGWDPHVWLGIEQAIGMVQAIRDELKQADPDRAAGYEARAAAYVEKLKKIQTDGKELLKDKKNRNIITNHDSLAYFARSFDLHIVGHLQTQPGVTVDGSHLAELVKTCDKSDVSLIAVEPQYNRASAETLRDELQRKGLKKTVAVVVIDPLETVEPALLNAEYYERGMRANLKTLADHLP